MANVGKDAVHGYEGLNAAWNILRSDIPSLSRQHVERNYLFSFQVPSRHVPFHVNMSEKQTYYDC